jgi:hypothetical protein
MAVTGPTQQIIVDYDTEPIPKKGVGSRSYFLSKLTMVKGSIDIAIKKYHAKQGQLEVREAEAKAKEANG